MKYYIIAGEASGDLHGSNLVRALRQQDPEAEIRAWGGDLMEAAGAHIVKHYRELAFMGFWEVMVNLRTILRNLEFCREDIARFQPDALILIDYPGFNLRMARWAKPEGFRVFYYISPQLWAWHSSRVKQIKRSVDRMFVILPFEEDFYKKYDYPVDFVGHPLLDVIQSHPRTEGFREAMGLPAEGPLVALLPGSRRQEISRMLPVMLQVVPHFPQCHFAVAGAPSIPDSFYEEIFQRTAAQHQLSANMARVHLIRNQTYKLLQAADAALVTSGTATLETALFKVPQVVGYRGSRLSYLIARQLVNIKYIALVNLIVDRPLVTELIQDDFNPQRLKVELEGLLEPENRRRLLHGYDELHQRLGQAGASRRTAELMLRYLLDREKSSRAATEHI